MKSALPFLLAAALLPAQLEEPPPQLRFAVQDYWTGLGQDDKARALKHVHPDTLNAFLKRNEPALEDWEIEEYERLDAERFLVTATFKRHSPGGVLASARARETWQLTEDGWKVRVLSKEEQRQRAYQAIRRQANWPQKLQVLPATLRFRTASDQPGVIVVRNGLEEAVRIVKLEADQKLFEVKMPDQLTVAPRSVERIALYWAAEDETAEPEPAQTAPAREEVTLVLEVGQEIRRYPIPYLVDPEDPLLEWIKRQRPPPSRPRPPRNQP